MKAPFRSALLTMAIALCPLATGSGEARAQETPGVTLTTLMQAALEGTDSTEVIMSLVDAKPGFTFPMHWHPGEEFVYVIEGSGTASIKGEPEVKLGVGDVLKVPLRRAHTATAGKKGFKAIVFRVHRTGQPERVLVE